MTFKSTYHRVCKYCGSILRPDRIVCSGCHKDMDGVLKGTEVGPPQWVEKPRIAREPKKKRRK